MRTAQDPTTRPYGTPAANNLNIRQIRRHQPDQITVSSIPKNTKRFYTAWSESSPNRLGRKGLPLANLRSRANPNQGPVLSWKRIFVLISKIKEVICFPIFSYNTEVNDGSGTPTLDPTPSAHGDRAEKVHLTDRYAAMA
jgi:hypothetical protein